MLRAIPVARDLGASRSPEARIILGAVVIDDVLGLVTPVALKWSLSRTARGAAVA